MIYARFQSVFSKAKGNDKQLALSLKISKIKIFNYSFCGLKVEEECKRASISSKFEPLDQPFW